MRPSPASEARGRRPLLVGGSGLYCGRSSTTSRSPARIRPLAPISSDEADALGAAGLYRRLVSADPVAAAKIEPGNVRRTVRALEVAAVTGRSFSEFATAWDEYPAGRVRAVGVELPREVLADRVGHRVRAMLEAGLLEEVRGLVDRGFGRLAHLEPGHRLR